ncbi:MAG: hypothetical protein AAB849_02955 [Patescibacteria group bacterium]
MCALPVEARQQFAESPDVDQESAQQAKKVELRLVPPSVEDDVLKKEAKMEKLPVRLVLDQKFERMNQIMRRWQQEPAPVKPADLGEKGMSFDLMAFVNLYDVVKNHPDLLNAEQQARYQEIAAEVKKHFNGKSLVRIGIKDV